MPLVCSPLRLSNLLSAHSPPLSVRLLCRYKIQMDEQIDIHKSGSTLIISVYLEHSQHLQLATSAAALSLSLSPSTSVVVFTAAFMPLRLLPLSVSVSVSISAYTAAWHFINRLTQQQQQQQEKRCQVKVESKTMQAAMATTGQKRQRGEAGSRQTGGVACSYFVARCRSVAKKYLRI